MLVGLQAATGLHRNTDYNGSLARAPLASTLPKLPERRHGLEQAKFI